MSDNIDAGPLLRYAVRNLRHTDIIEYLRGATDGNDLYARMATASGLRTNLFENTELWPPEQREGMWKAVLQANKETEDAKTQGERNERE